MAYVKGEQKFSRVPKLNPAPAACETAKGFAKHAEKLRLRVFCVNHASLQSIADCLRIVSETDESAVYLVRLECGCERDVAQGVTRTETQKAALKASKTRAATMK